MQIVEQFINLLLTTFPYLPFEWKPEIEIQAKKTRENFHEQNFYICETRLINRSMCKTENNDVKVLPFIFFCKSHSSETSSGTST